jgi:hypothetical protein
MMTLWMHATDSLPQMFLARMIVLAAAIGMAILVFGLGAAVVRGVEAVKLRFGRRAYSGAVVRRYQRAVN